jgi:hypothetical protein
VGCADLSQTFVTSVPSHLHLRSFDYWKHRWKLTLKMGLWFSDLRFGPG